MSSYTTKWTSPQTVNQDARKGIINKGKCYKFSQLDTIKKEDDKSAYIPTSGGVNYNHASPIVYCSNFGFNIPANAVIEKVAVRSITQQGNTVNSTLIKTKLIKLKTTASTTDGGVGNDVSVHSTWVRKPNWRDTYNERTPTQWGVTLTPQMINNTNFGCVYQCIGTGRWVMPRIKLIQMRVTYTIPETVNKILKASFNSVLKYKDESSWKPFPQKDWSNTAPSMSVTDDSISIMVEFTQKLTEGTFPAGNTPIVKFASNTITFTDKKTSTADLVTKQVKSVTPQYKDGKLVNSPVYQVYTTIYPGTVAGEQYFTMTIDNTTYTYKVNITKDDEKVPTVPHLQKLESENQKLVLRACDFVDGYAKYGGGYAILQEKEKKFCSLTWSNSRGQKCELGWENCPYNDGIRDSCPYDETYGGGYDNTDKEEAKKSTKCRLN